MPAIRGVTYVGLSVRDVHRSAAWYADIDAGVDAERREERGRDVAETACTDARQDRFRAEHGGRL
jgi:hypothetical protein